MFKIIAIVLVVVIAGILIYAATRPDDFRVERSIVIKASPDKLYPLIDDLHQWPSWSPYEKYDAAMLRNYSGAETGKGAVYTWNGNKKVGEGRMEITDTLAPEKIVIKLDFVRPFEGHNTAKFTLLPSSDGTTVTWAMYGPSPFISKLAGVFMNMDQLIGKDFEAGLANLKTLAESQAST